MIKKCDCEPFQGCELCRIDLSKQTRKKKKKGKIKPPREKHCRKLGYVTGTEAWRHAESRIIKFEHGGGIMGAKLPDSETAWLSSGVDAELSQPLPLDASQEELESHAVEWRMLIKLSHL